MISQDLLGKVKKWKRKDCKSRQSKENVRRGDKGKIRGKRKPKIILDPCCTLSYLFFFCLFFFSIYVLEYWSFLFAIRNIS